MRKKGQSTLEFMVLIAIVVAAIICMQSYVKRSIQGHMRKDADEIGGGGYYSPGLTTSNSATTITPTEKTYSGRKKDIPQDFAGVDIPESLEDEDHITISISNSKTATDKTERIGALADEPW